MAGAPVAILDREDDGHKDVEPRAGRSLGLHTSPGLLLHKRGIKFHLFEAFVNPQRIYLPQRVAGRIKKIIQTK